MAADISGKTTSRAFLVELGEEMPTVPLATVTTDPKLQKPSTCKKRKFEKVEEPIVEEIDEDEDSFYETNTATQPPAEHKPKKKTPDPQPQISCFTCFVGPCPEPINANYQHSEFMICYRDPNSRCENNMMRYYCCPLCLVTVEKDGEETYELRAARTESNLHSNCDYNQQRGYEWHYCNSQHPRMQQGHHPHMSHHSFSAHSFNCHQLPPQFNFLHNCSCTCPPQMMASFFNHRYPQGYTQPQAQQPVFCHFNYQPNYMYPNNGSAMG